MRRLVVATLLLAGAPGVIVWSMGLYDDLATAHAARALGEAGEVLSVELARGGVADERLAAVAREHRVLLRVVAASGEVVARTAPEDALGLWGRGAWADLADVFFGPGGPPDLLAFEAGVGPEGARAEVDEARRTGHAQALRLTAERHAYVLYDARTLGDTGEVLYLTRVSRRAVRLLYDVRYQVLKLTLAMLVGGLLVGAWLVRSVVTPIVRLEAEVRARGAAGPWAPLALARQDEIGALSREFDGLAERLRERQVRTTQLTADLAHDLKNPIAVVASSAELLTSDVPPDAARRQRIARAMADAAQHLERSVTAMLALARLDEELPREVWAPVDVVALVRRVVDARAGDPRTTHLRFEVVAPPSAVVLGAETRLESLLSNLVDNAQVFARSQICIQVEQGAREVSLSVGDDGPGVSPGNRDKIFQRFFSVRPDGAAPGSGLGLTMVQAIVEAHHGAITLVDSPLGGACFRVVLPLGELDERTERT